MRLSDVMSSLGLAIFPIIALGLFLSVFVGVVLRVTGRARRAELDGAALLPLAEEVSSTPRSEVRATETTR
jgi:cbb3-type cytochrome oxidase subunit 3